jgi:hypothetical protein
LLAALSNICFLTPFTNVFSDKLLGEEHPGKLIESLADLAQSEKSRLLAGTAREFLALT